MSESEQPNNVVDNTAGTLVGPPDEKHSERSRLETALRKLAQRESELARVHVELQKFKDELQQFAYAASHDLQTPLRGIVGFAQILQQDYRGKLDDNADEHIDQIVGSCNQMNRMINDLLSYSRVESRAKPFGATDLNEVIDDTVVMLASQINDCGGEVTRGDLPTVSGDRSQLSQLVRNLISNGLQYHGDDPPQVHVSLENNGSGESIAVRDNGIGIAESQFERIFELFRRLHTEQQYPGTGGGLAICRRIVHRHGGKIWLESECGKGTTFYFTIAMQRTDNQSAIDPMRSDL